MNTEDIRCLPYYLIPKDWEIYLINRKTDEKQLQYFQELIENARLFAFDTETMPSFYNSYQKNSKPSLLQVAIRDHSHENKNVLLFDLQELFDQTYHPHPFRPCSLQTQIHDLIQFIFNHSHAYKLSQSLFNDLAQLKCSYDEDCFHRSRLDHLIELSDLYRRIFPQEKDQHIYGLQRMTAMTLHCQLDKKQQCANWSKRPLSRSLIDYAAMDVIVMIDIYERLKRRLEQEQQWEIVQRAIVTSLDLNEIVIYSCLCGERFITSKARNKHARTCFQAQTQIEHEVDLQKTNNDKISNMTEYNSNQISPRGRGYIPPALKQAYQSLQEPHRPSFNKPIIETRPLDDAHVFHDDDDDDSEVAQAFGLALENTIAKPKIEPIETQTNMSKQNFKVAAYPPKPISKSARITKVVDDENDLLNRLQDDFDSQPEFHCHLFGLGGRGRSLSTQLSPYEPSFTRRNDYR